MRSLEYSNCMYVHISYLYCTRMDTVKGYLYGYDDFFCLVDELQSSQISHAEEAFLWSRRLIGGEPKHSF